MEHSIFYQLSLVMAIAAIVSLVVHKFKQPLIIGYIISGILVGPSLLGLIHDHAAFESFSQIGIALLLFIIGLGLNIGIIKSTGKPVLLTFISIVIGVGALGFLTSRLFGFELSESLVMATALLFSSTIIVVKSLSDKKEQSRLYGRIAIGILLTEDLMATLALVVVAAAAGKGSISDFGFLLGKGIGIGVILSLLGLYVMPRFSRLFASSQELLYVFALAWAFGVASVFWKSGFSVEVGALFAGVSLAHLPYAEAISSRLKPLRDFFIVLFFITLGEELGIDNLSAALIPALTFSAIIMVSKPLLIMTSLGFLGYTKQTSFKAAANLSQISEFSIVLIVLAQNVGIASSRLTAITTLTALITIALSAYLMQYDNSLFRRFQKQLSVFERNKTKKEVQAMGHYPLILLGYREGGYSYVQTFRDMKKRYIVVDYSPEVIESLERQHITHLYGDATDPELLDEIGLHKSELVISTISDAATNHMLAKHITEANETAIFICPASTLDDAAMLYDSGASYVLMPHFIGNEHINQFLRRNGNSKHAFEKYRHDHLLAIGNAALHLK